jgi:hypothetical protein
VIVSIHQPEHFPYIGFFKKMKQSDMFVILDDAKYSKGNFHNRNRFLNKNGVDEWFTIQVEKDAYKKEMRYVQTVNDSVWRKKIVKQLYYRFGVDFSDIYEGSSLIDMNMHSIEWGRKMLNISTPILFSSSLNITTTRTQRIIDICKAVGADEYLSGRGSIDEKHGSYLDKSLFTDMKLTVFDGEITNYYTVIQEVLG